VLFIHATVVNLFFWVTDFFNPSRIFLAVIKSIINSISFLVCFLSGTLI
jgi:hypothetical protein